MPSSSQTIRKKLSSAVLLLIVFFTVVNIEYRLTKSDEFICMVESRDGVLTRDFTGYGDVQPVPLEIESSSGVIVLDARFLDSSQSWYSLDQLVALGNELAEGDTLSTSYCVFERWLFFETVYPIEIIDGSETLYSIDPRVLESMVRSLEKNLANIWLKTLTFFLVVAVVLFGKNVLSIGLKYFRS